MPGSAAQRQPSPRPSATGASTLAVIGAGRDALVQLLRTLAARLDELDRALADLAWHQRRSRVTPGCGETYCERAALEAEQERLTIRLGALASQLKVLDSKLADISDNGDDLSTMLSTCPYCGYPSRGFGPCAPCRPELAS